MELEISRRRGLRLAIDNNPGAVLVSRGDCEAGVFRPGGL